MKQVDFYQLGRDGADRVCAMLARKALGGGGRLLVTSADEGQCERISRALWNAGAELFLVHGRADAPHAERQPILLGQGCEAVNGASIIVLADGKWREEARRFERVLILFSPEHRKMARDLWRALSAQEGLALQIYKQDEAGRWRAGA